MSDAQVIKDFVAYMDREERRLKQAHKALSAIPKNKRTADDKRRLEAVGNEIHITGTHTSMLLNLQTLDQLRTKSKRKDIQDLIESGQGNPNK